jgi:hypothetical protein
MTRPTKHPRTGIYRVRKAVPALLREVAGKREWVETLRTTDWQAAKALAPDAMARIDSMHTAALAALQGTASLLSAREVAAVVGAWRRGAVEQVERDPGRLEDRDGALDMLYDAVPGPEGGSHALLEEREDGREYFPGPSALAEAAEVIRLQGKVAPLESVRAVAIGLFWAKIEVEKLALRRIEGDWSVDDGAARYPVAPVPAKPGDRPAPSPRSTPSVLPLSGTALVDAWAAERNPSPATRRKYATTFRHLARILGHDDVRRIGVEDVVAFKAARLKEGRDAGTVADDVR